MFAQLAQEKLLNRVHAELIKTQLGEHGHISRAASAIEAREQPLYKSVPEPSTPEPGAKKKAKRKRGRACAGAEPQCQAPTRIAIPMQQAVAVSLAELPTACDRGTSLYDVMDAAYCSEELRTHCRN